jgi:hypothetical protein
MTSDSFQIQRYCEQCRWRKEQRRNCSNCRTLIASKRTFIPLRWACGAHVQRTKSLLSSPCLRWRRSYAADAIVMASRAKPQSSAPINDVCRQGCGFEARTTDAVPLRRQSWSSPMQLRARCGLSCLPPCSLNRETNANWQFRKVSLVAAVLDGNKASISSHTNSDDPWKVFFYICSSTRRTNFTPN